MRRYPADQVTFGSRADVFQAEIVAQVRTPGANPAGGAADVALIAPRPDR